MSAELLGQAIRTIAGRPSGLTFGTGTVTVSSGNKLAKVTGITVEPIWIGRDNWQSPFIASVTAGSVNGRRVVVKFIDGQAIIESTLGD